MLNLALPFNALIILSFQPAVLISLHLHLLPADFYLLAFCLSVFQFNAVCDLHRSLITWHFADLLIESYLL